MATTEQIITPGAGDFIATSLRQTGVAAIRVDHRMSRYIVVITALDEIPAIDEEGADLDLARALGNRYLVTLANFGTAYQFSLPGHFYGDYVGEKLCDGNRADGGAVADILNGISEGMRD